MYKGSISKKALVATLLGAALTVGCGPTTGNEEGVPARLGQAMRAQDTHHLATGREHAVALRAGEVWAWGDNGNGQLGSGAAAINKSPVQVAGLSGVNVVAVSGGLTHVLALDSNGDVWTWGGNNYGQLGRGSISTKIATPAKVSGLSNIVAIAAGFDHSLAVDANGGVWAWGRNDQGQLGNTTIPISSSSYSITPVQVTGLSGVVDVGGGIGYSLAVRSETTGGNTLWAWGDNSFSQLGDGTSTDRSTPVQVSNLTDVVFADGSVSTRLHTIALKTNGTVWSWGSDGTGQLGDGTALCPYIQGDFSYVPIQADSSLLTNVLYVSAGDQFSVAERSDGTVWSWGSNSAGQLGTNSPAGGCNPTPQQVLFQ